MRVCACMRLSMRVLARALCVGGGCCVGSCFPLARLQAGGVQERMKPAAVLSLLAYTVGMPASFFVILFTHRTAIFEDQTMRMRGLGGTPLTNPNFHVRRRFEKLYRYVHAARVIACAACAAGASVDCENDRHGSRVRLTEGVTPVGPRFCVCARVCVCVFVLGTYAAYFSVCSDRRCRGGAWCSWFGSSPSWR